MNGAAWLCVAIITLAVLISIYRSAYARGYAAGQYKERRAVASVLNDMRQQCLQAERDIDYLYERAWRQITASAQREGNDRA